MTYDVELVELPVQPVAVVCGRITEEEIRTFLGGVFADVLRTLTDQRLAPAGPPFGRYRPVDGRFDVEAGFPVTAAVASAGRVEPGELPGGPAARVLHRDDYGGVGAAYQAAADWLTTHGYVAAAPPWECYLDGPEAAEPRTVVYLPCRRAE